MAKQTKKHDVPETQYDCMLIEAYKWYKTATTPEEKKVALASWKELSDARQCELDRLSRESEGHKNRIVELVRGFLDFGSNMFVGGVKLYAFNKGYRLEKYEHGVFTGLTEKEAFKQVTNISRK